MLSGEAVLTDLGVHRLKDLAAPKRVWQLGDGLFAALRTLDAVAHNLPIEPTNLVDRTDERATVLNLLEQHRIVTITGAGGIGKTRVALAAAADLVECFADGVWLCERGAVGTNDAVAHAVAGFSAQCSARAGP